MSFYDIHSHMLPQVDDGAESLSMSLNMVKCAVEQGVSDLVFTPHMNLRKVKDFDYLQHIKNTFAYVKKAIEDESLDINVYLGNELLYYQSCAADLDQGAILTLNGTRCVLVEFLPEERFKVIQSAMIELLYHRYQPVIAHVERIACLQKNPALLDELKSMDALFQMNYSSITGSIFDSRVRYCRKLVKEGYIDLFGSDAHNMKERAPRYQEAVTWLKKHCSEEEIRRMLMDNPPLVLQEQ